jgi:hypothetical protein
LVPSRSGWAPTRLTRHMESNADVRQRRGVGGHGDGVMRRCVDAPDHVAVMACPTDMTCRRRLGLIRVVSGGASYRDSRTVTTHVSAPYRARLRLRPTPRYAQLPRHGRQALRPVPISRKPVPGPRYPAGSPPESLSKPDQSGCCLSRLDRLGAILECKHWHRNPGPARARTESGVLACQLFQRPCLSCCYRDGPTRSHGPG